jgi:hypothetical protein
MLTDHAGLAVVALDAHRIVYGLGFSDGLIIIRFAIASENSHLLPDQPPANPVPDSFLDGHHGPITALAFGIDDYRAYLISASSKNEVILWQNSFGQWQNVWQQSVQGLPCSVAFAENGETFALALSTGEVSIWDLSRGYDYLDSTHVEMVGPCAVGFSRGNLVTVDGGGDLSVWSPDYSQRTTLQISPWAVRLLSACSDAVAVVARGTGETTEIVRIIHRDEDKLRPGVAIPARFTSIPVSMKSLGLSADGINRVRTSEVIGLYWEVPGQVIGVMSYIEYRSPTDPPGEIWVSVFTQLMDGRWEQTEIRRPAKKEPAKA